MGVYLALWVIALSAMLLSKPTQASTFVPLVAAWKIADIISYRVYFLIVKSRTVRWRRSLARATFVMAVMNVLELQIAFASLYLTWAPVVSSGKEPVLLRSPIAAFYFSVVTMTTVGFGDFVPANDVARLFVICEILAGALMFLFIVPALLAAVSELLNEGGPKGST